MKYSSLLSALQNALSELGPINNIAPIQQGLRALHNFSHLVYADVYLSTAIAVDVSHPFWRLCPLKDKTESDYGDYFLRFYYENQLPTRKLGVSQSAFVIVVLDDNLLLEDKLLYHLKRYVTQNVVLIILNYTGNDEIAKNVKYDFHGKFVILDMGSVTALSLNTILTDQIDPELKETLLERCYLNTLQPLLQLTNEAIQQEQYIAGVRKNINSQVSNVLRKEETGANISDLITGIKTQLQYWNNDTEKAIRVKYEELNKPVTGRYSQQLAAWSDELDDLDRKTIAEKAERIVTSINEKFLLNFEKQLNKEVASDFANDYNLFLSDADSTLGKMNYILEQKGIASQGSHSLIIDYSRFPNPEKTLRNYIGFSRAYSGELSKKGAAEYFAALREHTGSIMVAVGLLAPLNMIASASSGEASENKTGFFAQIAVFFKHMNNGIRISTAILIVIMIIWGYFDLRKRIPRKRQEEFERELKKARENLLTEGKRMFVESTKDWQTNVAQWVRETYSQLQVQLEKVARDYATLQQQKINDEKLRIQRLNQGLDNNTKRIANADRIMDGLLRSHKDAVIDMEKVFR